MTENEVEKEPKKSFLYYIFNWERGTVGLPPDKAEKIKEALLRAAESNQSGKEIRR